jgi:hypothetical protein
MRIILPVNTEISRPHYLANNFSPYMCGQCGHECSNVQDQAIHMYSEHPEFWTQVTAHTGVGESPEQVIEKFGNHEDVIHQDPVSLLHKMQRHISATQIACDFQNSAMFVNPDYADFFMQNVSYLEKLTLEYPGATEIYENIASGAQLLGQERMAADYWALAIESDVAFDRRILKLHHRLAINATMTRIKDEENRFLACTYPYRFSIAGIFAKSLFKKSYPDVAAWPSKRRIKPMIKALREDPSCQVEQGFRSVLVEFRDIKSTNDAIFEGLMSGTIDSDDIDRDEIDRLDGRVPVLKQCLDRCGYFIGAEKDYWQAHMQLYIAHRLARRSEIEQGLIAADTAISLFIEFEARTDYPDCVPIDLIQYYGAGGVWSSVHAHLTKAGLLSQDERTEEASSAYGASVDRAKAPAIRDYYLVLALTKAGEHHLMHDRSKTIDYFSQAIDIIESSGVSLADAVENGDFQLLKLKDTLMMAHSMAGNINETDALKSEIAPYQEHVTWRFETSYVDEDDAP